MIKWEWPHRWRNVKARREAEERLQEALWALIRAAQRGSKRRMSFTVEDVRLDGEEIGDWSIEVKRLGEA